MLSRSAPAALLWTAAHASATILYAASYSGTVTTLNFTSPAGYQVGGRAPVPLLKTVATTKGCKGSPSWLTLDHPNSVLYCIDEGLSADASLSSYATNDDGSLTQLDKVTTITGPVSGVFYGHDHNGFAMAHYDGSAVSAWDIADPTAIKAIQQKVFKLDGPGTDPDRQDKPHPHEVVMDPTDQFLLVPDLGADLVRVFAPDPVTLELTARAPIKVAAGSGPRHLAFAVRGGRTFMYLATELANTIVGYEVTYPGDSIKFREIFTIGAHGKGTQAPKGSSAAEVVVSPDAKYLILSMRDENKLKIPNFDPKNSTAITSDPLVNFAIDGKTGKLTKIQEVACGGRQPRQFSMSKDGTLVAVGLQGDGRVVLIQRDVRSGRLGAFAGWANVAGQVTAVVFDE